MALVTRVTANNGFPRSIVRLILLQHGHCTFVTILFGPFARLFIKLAMCIRAPFPQTDNHSSSCRSSILEGATFHRMGVGASSFEVILACHWDSFLQTSGSRRISLILRHERTRRRIRLCQFCTLIDIVTETAIVSFRTLPVGFPLPTISKNSLSTLFCPLMLDHGVYLIISVSGLKILHSQILLDTSFHHCFQSVIIKSQFLLMNLQVIQFQYGLEIRRLSYS